ncbi:MAG: crossover junction endodeoxyribonuclease RuvC [Chlamydiota bacterium]|nr:crossover junction endodeoxyribonuclease RuvC [Chlamydiota bacterium]
MIIIGVDPGTVVTGYGIISFKGNEVIALEYGCIRPSGKKHVNDRCLIIHNGIEALIQKYQPDALAVETQYVSKNVQSTLKLGMAKAVVILAALRAGVKVEEYTPTTAKKAVTGKGGASKEQVQGMIQRLLNLSEIPQPEDAADALALAICHAQKLRFNQISYTSSSQSKLCC